VNRENATSARLAALSISSSDMYFTSRLRRVMREQPEREQQRADDQIMFESYIHFFLDTKERDGNRLKRRDAEGADLSENQHGT